MHINDEALQQSQAAIDRYALAYEKKQPDATAGRLVIKGWGEKRYIKYLEPNKVNWFTKHFGTRLDTVLKFCKKEGVWNETLGTAILHNTNNSFEGKKVRGWEKRVTNDVNERLLLHHDATSFMHKIINRTDHEMAKQFVKELLKPDDPKKNMSDSVLSTHQHLLQQALTLTSTTSRLVDKAFDKINVEHLSHKQSLTVMREAYEKGNLRFLDNFMTARRYKKGESADLPTAQDGWGEAENNMRKLVNNSTALKLAERSLKLAEGPLKLAEEHDVNTEKVTADDAMLAIHAITAKHWGSDMDPVIIGATINQLLKIHGAQGKARQSPALILALQKKNYPVALALMQLPKNDRLFPPSASNRELVKSWNDCAHGVYTNCVNDCRLDVFFQLLEREASYVWSSNKDDWLSMIVGVKDPSYDKVRYHICLLLVDKTLLADQKLPQHENNKETLKNALDIFQARPQSEDNKELVQLLIDRMPPETAISALIEKAATFLDEQPVTSAPQASVRLSTLQKKPQDYTHQEDLTGNTYEIMLKENLNKLKLSCQDEFKDKLSGSNQSIKITSWLRTK